jgi:RimJ/RimL family protein N-acetyltransferase
VIATKQLLLRTPDVSTDGDDVLTMMLDAETRLWNPHGDVADLDSAAAWCARQADWSDGTHASFAIVEAESGRFAGSVSIHSVDPAQADAEIGYRVAPWARGRGFATEAVTAATTWAFANLPVVRIELCHAAANPASCAVATKAGYPLEGVLRSSYIYGDGQRYDEHLHARLASDV